MKYEIKPEYRHLFDESIRDKKLPLEKTVNEGLYGEAWNDHSLTKEALQPVADFQKGEFLIWEGIKGDKVLFPLSDEDEEYFMSDFCYQQNGDYDHKYGLYKWAKERCHRPTDEELHDFLLGMVKARYNEGDVIKCMDYNTVRSVRFELYGDWNDLWNRDEVIWFLDEDGRVRRVMQKGKWAEKVGKKLALYAIEGIDGDWRVPSDRLYESDEDFKKKNPHFLGKFQRLTNTEF